MQLMRRVALGGVQLDSVDPAIVIQGIETQAGKDSVTSVPRGASGGSRVTGQRRDYLEIAVKFTINEKSYHPEARATVLEKVCRWASPGGVLTVNYKPGRQARVMCAQLPGEGDAAKRGAYTVTFRAYGVPYWTEPTGTGQLRDGGGVHVYEPEQQHVHLGAGDRAEGERKIKPDRPGAERDDSF